MRYRIYDNVDKKYIPEEHANHFFCLDIYGKVVKYDHVLGFMETGDRYTVEVSIGKEDFTGKTIYDGDTAIDQDDEEVLIEYDKEDAMFHIVYGTYVETFSVIDSKDLKVNGNIHGGSDER